MYISTLKPCIKMLISRNRNYRHPRIMGRRNTTPLYCSLSLSNQHSPPDYNHIALSHTTSHTATRHSSPLISLNIMYPSGPSTSPSLNWSFSCPISNVFTSIPQTLFQLQLGRLTMSFINRSSKREKLQTGWVPNTRHHELKHKRKKIVF